MTYPHAYCVECDRPLPIGQKCKLCHRCVGEKCPHGQRMGKCGFCDYYERRKA